MISHTTSEKDKHDRNEGKNVTPNWNTMSGTTPKEVLLT